MNNAIRVSIREGYSYAEYQYNIIKEELTTTNPKFQENLKRGYSNWNTPDKLKFYKETGRYVLLAPRGYIDRLKVMNKECEGNIIYSISTNFFEKTGLMLSFKGKLKPYQRYAVRDVLKYDIGVLESPTGSGKTVMAVYTIVERDVPTLIVVHNKELMYQWRDRIAEYTTLPPDEICLYGDGKKRIGRITIAIINSLVKALDKFKTGFGYIIVDECHRAAAKTFIDATTAIPATYMLGLSATPYRSDGLTKLVNLYMGDTRHQVSLKELQDAGQVMVAKYIMTNTSFQIDYDPEIDSYSELINKLIKDGLRNSLIRDDVVRHMDRYGKVALVISDRIEHCKYFYDYFTDYKKYEVAMITGNTPPAQRNDIISDVRAGKYGILIATGQLVGEGLDIKNLSSIYITTPISFKGRITQYVGRILRAMEGKEGAYIYDYNDHRIGVLMASAVKRQKAYRELNMTRTSWVLEV